MRTLLDTTTRVSIYLFTDESTAYLDTDGLHIEGQDLVQGVSSADSIIIDGVSPPDNWYGCRYLYTEAGEWITNPNDPMTIGQ